MAGGEFGIGETFYAHESELNSGSGFFVAALRESKKLAEGQQKKIELPETPPNIVATYVHFVYKEELPKWCTGAGEVESEAEIEKEYMHLMQLYVFGEKLQDNGFCNAIVDRLLSILDDVEGRWRYRYVPDEYAVKSLYDGTAEDSSARKLVVRMILTCTYTAEQLEDYKICPDFMADLAIALMESHPGCTERKTYKEAHKYYKPTA